MLRLQFELDGMSFDEAVELAPSVFLDSTKVFVNGATESNVYGEFFQRADARVPHQQKSRCLHPAH